MGDLNRQADVISDKGSATGHLMDEMKLSIYTKGVLEWSLVAEQAESFKDGFWELFQVNGSFQKGDQSEVKFVGDKGSVDLAEKFVTLEGDVNAESLNGYKFETESLNLRGEGEKKSIFYSNDRVKIYNKAEKLEVFSKGILGDVETGEVELLSDVSCRNSVKQYKDILIRSESAKFKRSLKSIRFSDNLRISQADFNIKGEEAYFVYDEIKKTLKSVQVEGDILASDGEKTALSDSVEMRTTEDVILFKGNPRVRVGKNEMIGEEILITNKQKNIQVIRGNIKSTKKGVDLDE